MRPLYDNCVEMTCYFPNRLAEETLMAGEVAKKSV